MTAFEQYRMFELMGLNAEGKATPEQARKARMLWERYQDEMEAERRTYQIDPGPAL